MRVYSKYLFALLLILFVGGADSVYALTQVYVVRKGDSLSEIAERFGLGLRELKHLNGLRSSRIYVGQKLRVQETVSDEYVVRKGDSLSEIAEHFGLRLSELRRLNGLRTNRIYVGQKLRLRKVQQTRRAFSNEYVVRKGDSLSEIAESFGLGLSELERINGLRSSRIWVGQKLRVRAAVTPIPDIPAENGPYYYHKPKAPAQQSRNYREPSKFSPLEDYRKGKNLLFALNEDVDAQLRKYRKKNQPLKGWKIVIDPGHGGIDPGAIVANTDGVKRSVFVVEDEYVYDISLRLYKKLRFYGADVKLTVISPNHQIRENLQAAVTFVHEQNEVYNDERLNRRNHPSVRPALNNISQRVRIANRFFKGTSRNRTLFLSIHADNSPKRPKGPLVIYHERRGKIDTRSRAFARIMQKAVDHPGVRAQIGGRNLAVLRGNQAYAEILVEIRNVHDQGEAWALRFHEKRDQDADRIFQGVLNYVKK